MQRIVLLLLSVFISLLLITNTWAQEDLPGEPSSPVQLPFHPSQMVGTTPTAILHTETGDDYLVLAASDTCAAAAGLTVPGGDSDSTINDLFDNTGDPDLACAWGTPDDPKGDFTGWYQFSAPQHGVVTIDTTGSNYDTIVSVFTDGNPNDSTPACSDLRLVACNDDSHGFTSRVQFSATKGTTYYVQFAAWQSGGSSTKNLLFSLEMDSLNSLWEQMGSMSEPRSRHATAIVGNNIYVIGGQTVDFDPFNGIDEPTLTNHLDKYNTATGVWTRLADMPSPAPDAGYSNTTAAYVNKTNNAGGCTSGCIYLPGGFNGGTSFDGTHWAYDIANNQWLEKASVGDQLGWPGGAPFAWSASVAKPDNTGYYLLGGLSSQPPITDTTALVHDKVYFYRVSDNQWIDALPDMTIARYAHMAAYVNGEVCVIGGIEASGQITPNGECWNPNGSGGWRNLPALNESRFAAGSAVGPDGKWYIYGGSRADFQALSTVEVYDPANPAAGWITLNVTHDLGVTEALPARIWPRGGFVGNYLWAVGGNDSQDFFNRTRIPIMERLFVGKHTLLLPFLMNNDSNADDHFGVAPKINFNVTYFKNFDTILDKYDIFYVDLATNDTITVKLRDIPGGSDYNVYVYDGDKDLWGTGNNPNNENETVTLTLAPARYYIMVERFQPTGLPDTDNYRLIVEK